MACVTLLAARRRDDPSLTPRHRRGCDRACPPLLIPAHALVQYHSKQGDANLSAYLGDARGVLFNATTVDNWVQCGYLPLSLLRE